MLKLEINICIRKLYLCRWKGLANLIFFIIFQLLCIVDLKVKQYVFFFQNTLYFQVLSFFRSPDLFTQVRPNLAGGAEHKDKSEN